MNLEIIRQVLASAARAKLPMAQEAMDELVSVNTEMLSKPVRVMSKPAKVGRVRSDEDYNQGGGNIHG